MEFKLYEQSRAGRLAKQATNNQPTNQLTSQPASQQTAEQTYLTTLKTKDYDPPCLAYFIVKGGRKGGREGGRKGSLLGVSNQLKIGYI